MDRATECGTIPLTELEKKAAQLAIPLIAGGRDEFGRPMRRVGVRGEDARFGRPLDQALDLERGRSRGGRGRVFDDLDRPVEAIGRFDEASLAEPHLCKGGGCLPKNAGTRRLAENTLVFVDGPATCHQILRHAQTKHGEAPLHGNLIFSTNGVGRNRVGELFGFGVDAGIDHFIELRDRPLAVERESRAARQETDS